MGYREELINKYTNKKGYKPRVIAKCISCSYDEYDTGTHLAQIRDCGVVSCPLYAVRPLPSQRVDKACINDVPRDIEE